MAPKRKTVATKSAAAKAAAKAKDVAKEAAKKVQEEENEDVVEEKPPSRKKARTEKKKTPPKKGRTAKVTPKQKIAATPKETESPVPSKETAKVPEEASNATGPQVIIIEASKEDNSFKVIAAKVESGLKVAIPGVEIKVNPEKPRKGRFEIRDEKGAILFSLQRLSRPYTKLKNMDVESTVGEVAAKIKLT